MICKNCGHRISGAAAFCSFCGRNNQTGELPQNVAKATENAPENATGYVASEVPPALTGEAAASAPVAVAEKIETNVPEQSEQAAAPSVPMSVPQTTNNTPKQSAQDYTAFYQQYYQNKTNHNKAVASLVLGIISAIMWLFPLLGIPMTIVGIVLGAQSRKKAPQDSGMATAGMVLSIIFLVLTCLWLLTRTLFALVTAFSSFGF